MVKVGFIGTGHFTSGNHLPNCRDNPNVHIRAMCRRDMELLKEQAKEYNPDYITADYHKLLKDDELDLIFVGTRSNEHVRFVKELAEAGKNIFVEKPMAITSEECEAIVKEVRKHKVRLMVGYNRRFAPIMIEAKRIFKKLPQPAIITYRIVDDARLWPEWPFDPKIGGGKLMSEGCHIFDLLSWFTDSEPVRVFAEGWVRDDNVVTVKFANDTIAVIISGGKGSVRYPKELMEVFCDSKTIVADGMVELKVDGIEGAEDKVYPLLRDPYKDKVKEEGIVGLRKKWQLFEKNITAKQREEGSYYDTMPIIDKGHYGEIDAYAQAISKGKPSPVNEVDGFRATLCCLKAIESLKTHLPRDITKKDYYG